MRTLLSHIRLLLGLVLLGICALRPALASGLPDIGDASEQVLSPAQQAKLGEEAMRNMRRAGALLDDPELDGYLNSIGRQLVSYSDDADQHFTFFFVRDKTINAFAMPGNYIGVNLGLILATRSEGELASVLAHEISHITQHHIERYFAKSSKLQLPLAAAMIAAILVGGNNPQVTEAAIASTMAGSQQASLNFTRDNEEEADRVGIDLLSRAGYDPEDMAKFFGRLQKESRYAEVAPEFLSTHPVTPHRIADAENRAAQLPHPQHTDSEAYRYAKARIAVLLAAQPKDLISRLTKPSPGDSPPPSGTVLKYELALARFRAGEHSQALSAIDKLLSHHPDHLPVINAAGTLHREANDYRRAERIFRQGLDLYPDNHTLTLGLAEALRVGRDYTGLQTLLNTRTLSELNNARGYALLAEAEAHLGHAAASHLAQAEYHVKLGENSAAIDQLELALRTGGKDFYQSARAEALLDELKNEKKMEEKPQQTRPNP